MYYIEDGLGAGKRWLALVFAVLGCAASFGIGNMAQSCEISGAAKALFGADVRLSGFITAALVGLVVIGGIKRIGTVTGYLVPAMSIFYVLVGAYVIIVRAQDVPQMLWRIVSEAFSLKAVGGGVFGCGMARALKLGFSRGVFSNEAGLGSAPIAHAASSETDPVRQGLYGIFEVFMDTIVICTMTALTLLCGEQNGIGIHWGESAGSELISASFGTVFGSRMGALLVALCLSLFALTTILSWALYGSRCSEFLFGTRCTSAYQGIFVGILVFGAIMKLEVVWNIADTLNGFMAIPNLIALLGMSGVVTKLTKDHFAREKQEL